MGVGTRGETGTHLQNVSGVVVILNVPTRSTVGADRTSLADVKVFDTGTGELGEASLGLGVLPVEGGSLGVVDGQVALVSISPEG